MKQELNLQNGQKRKMEVSGENPAKKVKKPKVKWHRHSKDFFCTFGDGGSLDQAYPVYSKRLKYNPSNLWSILEKMSKETNDWRQDEPIQNLIDPELFVCRISEKERRMRDKQAQLMDKNFIDSRTIRGKGDLAKKIVEARPVVAAQDLRSTYKWIPCIIQCRPDDKTATFLSPIHNLPMESNDQLYKEIGKVFKKVIRKLQKVSTEKPNITRTGRYAYYPPEPKKQTKVKAKNMTKKYDHTYKVIVKIQLYHIDDNTGYSGHWHLEGKTEKISGAAVYYFKMDEGLTGGAVKFRPKKIPQEYYQRNTGEQHEIEVNAQEGTALVFQNTIPHRVRMLKNSVGDGKTRKRGILTFFLVDDNHWDDIPATDETGCLNRDKIAAALSLVFDDVLIDTIISYSPFADDFMTYEEAIQFRNVSINQQIKNTDKWGSICFGNAGETHFFKHSDMVTIKEEHGTRKYDRTYVLQSEPGDKHWQVQDQYRIKASTVSSLNETAI